MPQDRIIVVDGTRYLVPPEFDVDTWRDHIEDFIVLKTRVVQKLLARLSPSDHQGRWEVWKQFGAWGVRLNAQGMPLKGSRRVQ